MIIKTILFYMGSSSNNECQTFHIIYNSSTTTGCGDCPSNGYYKYSENICLQGTCSNLYINVNGDNKCISDCSNNYKFFKI